MGAWVRVDLANGRLEMMMVLLFVMWSKRFMVEPITGASDWSGGALLLACFGGLDGGGAGNRVSLWEMGDY